MTHLTREQLAAIHAAKRSGVSKRDIFERDVARTAEARIQREVGSPEDISEKEQEELIDVRMRGKREFQHTAGGPTFIHKVGSRDFGRGQLTSPSHIHESFTKNEIAKLNAIERLEKTKSKEAFLRTNVLQRKNLEQLK